MIQKFDDASWHASGNFPADLPPEAAGIHIGIFLAWALLRGLGSSEAEAARIIVSNRLITPSQFAYQEFDGKITTDDFNDSGFDFAAHYYNIESCLYFIDYEIIFGSHYKSLYHVPDIWASCEKIFPLIDDRLNVFSK